MSYRNTAEYLTNAAGDLARRVRGALSRRLILNEESNGDHVTTLGREAYDGSHEQDEMDQLAPVGIIGRPADNASVESLVAFVGGDGSHPVSVSCVDGTRRAVIDSIGLKADETVVYTSKSVVKIKADGVVEIRSLDGNAKPLAYKLDADALNNRITALENQVNVMVGVLNANVGLYNALPPHSASLMSVVAPVSSTAVIEGTTTLKAE